MVSCLLLPASNANIRGVQRNSVAWHSVVDVASPPIFAGDDDSHDVAVLLRYIDRIRITRVGHEDDGTAAATGAAAAGAAAPP